MEHKRNEVSAFGKAILEVGLREISRQVFGAHRTMASDQSGFHVPSVTLDRLSVRLPAYEPIAVLDAAMAVTEAPNPAEAQQFIGIETRLARHMRLDRGMEVAGGHRGYHERARPPRTFKPSTIVLWAAPRPRLPCCRPAHVGLIHLDAPTQFPCQHIAFERVAQPMHQFPGALAAHDKLPGERTGRKPRAKEPNREHLF